MKKKGRAPSGHIVQHLESVRNFSFDQKVDLTSARLQFSTGKQLRQVCGTADAPLGERPILNTAKQVKAYYSGVIGTIGDRAECWTTRYPNMQADRDVELAFFEVLGKDLVKQYQSGKFTTAKDKRELATDLNVMRHYLKYEITNDAVLNLEMEKFRNPDKTVALLQRKASRDYERIAYWKSVDAKRRKATLDAFASALVAVSNDNPMTRPGLGQSLRTYTPTSRIVNSKNPALNVALNNLDRTVYGEKSYNNQMRRQAMAMARTKSSGSVMTLREHVPCTYSIPGKNCVSQEEFRSFNERQLAIDARNARTRSAAELAAIRAQAARIEAAERAAIAARGRGPAVIQ
ncbi:hypothetical protein SAMN06265173_10710 [Thalassovita litoralis]|uniref:Uncharacterized protein n=2 Tax=Thalassovita litoralis TaxID=1010611 RepID=A0A521CLZ8_9RHOB|nr:hypothetical protein SAMN06265173_10710 [Thalassovita litoralis]